MTRIAFIGGGGFSKEVDEVACLCGHDVVGYVGDVLGVLDRPYWGTVERLLENRHTFDAVFVAFGSVDRKSSIRRSAMLDWVIGNSIPSLPLVSPHSIRSHGVKIADGAFVAHGVTLSVDAVVHSFAILNSNAIIGHDAVIGRNATIAPGAFVGGGARIGDNSLIGPGALVLENRLVGHDVIVGLGATVVRDVKDGATVVPIRSRVLG